MWTVTTLIKVGDVDFYLRHYNVHGFDSLDLNENLGIVAKVGGLSYRNVTVEVSNYTNFNMFISLLVLKDSFDQDHIDDLSYHIAPTDIGATYLAVCPIKRRKRHGPCALLGPGETTGFNVRYNGHVEFCDFIINAEQVQASAEKDAPPLEPDFASNAGSYIRVELQKFIYMSKKMKKGLKSKTILNPLLRLDRMSSLDFTHYLGKNNESDAVALVITKAEAYFNDIELMFFYRTFSVFLNILVYELYKFHLLKRGWKVSALLASPACFNMMKIKVYRLANTLMLIDTNFNEDFFKFKDEQTLRAYEKDIYGLVDRFLEYLRNDKNCLPTDDSVTIANPFCRQISLNVPFDPTISSNLDTTASYLSKDTVFLKTATGLSMEKSHHDVTIKLNTDDLKSVVFYKYDISMGIGGSSREGAVVIIQLSNGYVLRGDRHGRVFTTDGAFTERSLNNRSVVDDRFWFVFTDPENPSKYFVEHVLTGRSIKHDQGRLSLGVLQRYDDSKFQFTVTSL